MPRSVRVPPRSAPACGLRSEVRPSALVPAARHLDPAAAAPRSDPELHRVRRRPWPLVRALRSPPPLRFRTIAHADGECRLACSPRACVRAWVVCLFRGAGPGGASTGPGPRDASSGPGVSGMATHTPDGRPIQFNGPPCGHCGTASSRDLILPDSAACWRHIPSLSLSLVSYVFVRVCGCRVVCVVRVVVQVRW